MPDNRAGLSLFVASLLSETVCLCKTELRRMRSRTAVSFVEIADDLLAYQPQVYRRREGELGVEIAVVPMDRTSGANPFTALSNVATNPGSMLYSTRHPLESFPQGFVSPPGAALCTIPEIMHNHTQPHSPLALPRESVKLRVTPPRSGGI